MFLKLSENERLNPKNIFSFKITSEDLRKLKTGIIESLTGQKKKQMIERNISIKKYDGLEGEYFYYFGTNIETNAEIMNILTEKIIKVFRVQIERTDGKMITIDRIFKSMKTANQYIDRLEQKLEKN